ncbi:extracellular matrix protein 1 [Pimephales promelas]|uniref:extracellular matrix protein 1 n=1 Tax=Pimephales promelas TaxID=90988 RepID=UPI001955BF72|nr:extracellular matrix protein 1 [Pimephales promelas]
MFWKSTLVVTTLILHLISLGVGQKLYPEVLLESNFPPARPSYYNLKAICYYGNGRPRFPDSIFPSSGYAYARRAGNAVNRLETWFSWCCYRGSAYVNEQTLCCAKQAWKTALSQFCIEEYSTMTLVHECCEKKKEERWNCFQKKAANPFYRPLSRYRAPMISPKGSFRWDPNTC